MKTKILLPVFIAVVSVLFPACNRQQEEQKRPNIIFILSDDLNWGDLGCFGQQKIKTPHIDRIAAEGIRFTSAYAGSAVCAPSRSTLMQGKHTGHARVRGNSHGRYRESLQPGDYTVAMMLKEAGYATGLFGKWGLALHNQPGIPQNMGFDEFFGYLNQQHAHCFFPEFLYQNKERILYPENGDFHLIENYRSEIPYDSLGRFIPPGIPDPTRAKYAFDEYAQRSLEFVKKNRDNPFFLYLAYTIPHGACIIPDLGIYSDMDWPVRAKEYAAMVTHMDHAVGELFSLLEELGLDENTLIFFASDNGVTNKPMAEFFNSFAPVRGGKGDTYDGAYRVPAMARWPGVTEPGQVSDFPWAFWDFMPTVAEITGQKVPEGIDGISILPLLTGKGKQKTHEFLYWEFQNDQSVRYGKWFARKPGGGTTELYDLEADPEQSIDLSNQFPEIIKEIEQVMRNEHSPSDVWPTPGEQEEDFAARLKKAGVPARPDNISLY